jgi:tetrahydromethanopterin S-methyltransferase subunit B
VLIGVIALVAIWKWTPALQLIQLFALIVLVPLAMLVAIGMVSKGTYDGIILGMQRAAEKRDALEPTAT